MLFFPNQTLLIEEANLLRSQHLLQKQVLLQHSLNLLSTVAAAHNHK